MAHVNKTYSHCVNDENTINRSGLIQLQKLKLLHWSFLSIVQRRLYFNDADSFHPHFNRSFTFTDNEIISAAEAAERHLLLVSVRLIFLDDA